MRVAIFFDGKNYYSALQQYAPQLEVDYDKLATWLSKKVGGPTGSFVGAYYYTGYYTGPVGAAASAGERFHNFLRGLELRPGYFVRREPRVRRHTKCKLCHKSYQYSAEKRVDTRLVADMIHYAAVDSYDAAVLLSGDQDFVPAVEAVNALGKRVYVAVWPGHGLSRELRVRCFDRVLLSQGISDFQTERERVVKDRVSTSDEDYPENMLAELKRAQKKFPYVERSFFVRKWKAKAPLPLPGEDRERLVSELISSGRIRETEAFSLDGRPVSALELAEPSGPDD